MPETSWIFCFFKQNLGSAAISVILIKHTKLLPSASTTILMAKVFHINLNHCAVAQDLLSQLIREEKANIVIISKQYRDLSKPSWVTNSTSTAAIWVYGELHIFKKMDVPLPRFTWIEVSGIRLQLLPHPAIQ